MNRAYVDSSCLVAVAFGEPGYERIVERLRSLDQAFTSNLAEAELRSAHLREGVEPDPELIGRLSWVLPDRPIGDEISRVLATGYLRGADVWHLATALYLVTDPHELSFLTIDQRQAAVATALGFPVMDEAAAPSGDSTNDTIRP